MQSAEVQLLKLDGKLDKHIGITETILINQKEILEDIREEMHKQNQRFVARDELTGFRVSLSDSIALQIANCKVDCHRDAQKAVDKAIKAVERTVHLGYGAVTTAIVLLYSGIELYSHFI